MLSADDITRLIRHVGFIRLSDSDGACACGQFAIGGIHIRAHCHRSGQCCAYGGIHIWKDQDWIGKDGDLLKLATFIAKRMGKDYMTEFEVVVSSREKETKMGYV